MFFNVGLNTVNRTFHSYSTWGSCNMSLTVDVDNPSGSNAYHSLESIHKEKQKPIQAAGSSTSLRQNITMSISCMRHYRMYKITVLVILLLIMLPLLAHRKLLYVS